MLGKQWSVSGSWTHAFKTPGNPAALTENNAASVGTATVQANMFSDAADQYAVGAKYRFNEFASWYVVASEITQGKGAHYCLGASGHGYQVCSRNASNDTIGGPTIRAVTTGLTLDF